MTAGKTAHQASLAHSVELVGSATTSSAHMDGVKTQDQYNGYMSEYMRNRYHALMNEARSYLGGKCVLCGSEVNLELDHIDPATKLFTVSNGCSKPREEFWAEVEKCQLLCVEHHVEKTAREASVGHGEGASGKRNCPCGPCRAKKASYMRSNSAKYKASARRAKTERLEKVAA